jgi:hypothetical protein
MQSLQDKFWAAKADGDEKTAAAIMHRLDSEHFKIGPTPQYVIDAGKQRAAEEMSPAQQMLGAMGGRAIRMGRGAGQLANMLSEGFNPSPYRYDPAPSQQAETEQRQMDAPLNRTGWGFSGDVTAQALPLAFGGVAARGTDAAGMFLPRTFAGSMAQGATLGAMQPQGVGEGGLNRLQNMGLGALAGGGGYGVASGLGGLARLAGGPLPLSGQAIENSAGRVIRGAATDPARLGMPAPSAIPGVQRTLAEESLDPGIAQLQRQFPVQLAEQHAGNNAARAQAIRAEFHGADDAAIQAIEQARDAEARRSLRGLRSNASVAVKPVVAGVDALIAKQKGRPAVQTALQYVKDQLESGITNADQAYNVRKTIGDLMEGRLSGDLAAATQAKTELMTVRYLLDREMRKAVPQWGEYLRGYKAASRQADQARVGQTLLNRGASATENPLTNERTLTPAAVSRLTNDPNQLVRTATGFRKASADRTLTPQQQATIAGLRDDLQRAESANNAGRAVGSNTAQNLGTMGRVGGVVEASLPIPAAARRVVSGGRDAYREYVNEQVSKLLANPSKAREVLARLPTKDRAAVLQAFSRLSGAAANSVVFPALQE